MCSTLTRPRPCAPSIVSQVTHRDTVNMIGETTGAALITKGVYVPPGRQAPEGERKIYLLIEGPTELSVKHAKQVSHVGSRGRLRAGSA